LQFCLHGYIFADLDFRNEGENYASLKRKKVTAVGLTIKRIKNPFVEVEEVFTCSLDNSMEITNFVRARGQRIFQQKLDTSFKNIIG
jgi:ribonucleotide reductase alpha subunit